MTNEEIQKVMEFIIKQQESFSEKLERMFAQIARRCARGAHQQLETAAIHLHNTPATQTARRPERGAART